jgi:hypothetical protein
MRFDEAAQFYLARRDNIQPKFMQTKNDLRNSNTETEAK